MGNIAEAHGRYSFEDKRRFLDVALGSCEELQSHLYIALDCAYIPQSGFDDAYRQADTPRRGIWADMPPATLRSRGRLPRLQEGRKRGALPAGPTERGGPHRRTPAVRRDVMALSNPPRGLCVPSWSTPISCNAQYAAAPWSGPTIFLVSPCDTAFVLRNDYRSMNTTVPTLNCRSNGTY
jgi:hypothetical protein